jgi:hypothetical protein
VLERFIENGAHGSRLYSCVGLSKQHAGRPVLKIHRFDGWNLKIVKNLRVQDVARQGLL